MHIKNFKFYRTVVVSSLIFILGFITINIIHFDADSNTFQKKLFESILPSTVEYISANIESFNSKYTLLSSVLASEINPQSFFVNGREDRDAVISRLRDIAGKTGVKTAGYVSLLTDTYYDSSGTVIDLDYSTERDKWVTDFLQQPSVSKSTFFDPENSKHLFAIYNDVKIFGPEGNADALFGLGISFGAAAEDFSTLAGDNKRIYFTDTSGDIHFPAKMRGKNIYDMYRIDRSDYKLSASNSDQYESIIYIPEENRDIVFYSDYISFLAKYLVIELDITEINRDITKQFVSSFVAGLILSIGIVAVNIFILNHSNHRHFRRAYKDPLTGSFNRRYLDHCFSERRSSFSKICTSLITLDIDHFKEINDTRGHLEGDEILKAVAEIAHSCIRENDSVIRWGGDEFVLIVYADIEDAFKIADRIRTSLISQTGVSITAGLTYLGQDEIFETAMKRADSALYKAKSEGRNRVYTA